MDAADLDALVGAAKAWQADDPDPTTRAEVDEILASADPGPALAQRFGARLEFGTAGLRGELGAGPNRMNRALVRRAAAGLAAWLLGPEAAAAGSGEARTRGVVIGRDARHGSAEFAEDSAAVLAGAGIPVHVLPEPLPTPVLAFAVLHLGAAAGVMVTASHNPPRDNGYKVYDGSGAQIVSPTDRHISAAIDAVGTVADLPLAPADDPLVHRLGGELLEAYVDGVLRLVPGPTDPGLRVVHTSMHGVGWATVSAVLGRAGFATVHPVPDQADPDPDFPTVAFPNPEEPGALDRALALAAEVEADVVLANDPDADRLAVALPDPSAPGGWRPLRGDETGVLLGDAALEAPPPPAWPADATRPPMVATTIVSSQLLGRMAEAAGVPCREVLTGFKWVARAPEPDHRLVLGYEEALGVCWGDLVRDKDGVSAALALLRREVVLRQRGSSLLRRLDDLARAHGLHETRQWSTRLEGADGLARRDAAMARMRTALPGELAGRVVERVDDLATEPNPLGLPASDVVVIRLAGGARVVVRPSGTEPKLKAYLEVVLPVGDEPGAVVEARTAARAELDALEAAVVAATGLG